MGPWNKCYWDAPCKCRPADEPAPPRPAPDIRAARPWDLPAADTHRNCDRAASPSERWAERRLRAAAVAALHSKAPRQTRQDRRSAGRPSPVVRYRHRRGARHDTGPAPDRAPTDSTARRPQPRFRQGRSPRSPDTSYASGFPLRNSPLILPALWEEDRAGTRRNRARARGEMLSPALRYLHWKP